jgi:hypothetical protein
MTCGWGGGGGLTRSVYVVGQNFEKPTACVLG